MIVRTDCARNRENVSSVIHAFPRPLSSILLALLVASRGPGLALSVEAAEELRPVWKRIAAVHPLPPGVEVSFQKPGAFRAGDRIAVEVGALPDGKTAARIAFAPVVRLWDKRWNVSLQEVRSGAVRVAPLESIRLPDIALPVDGLAADQSGYPLFVDVGLRLWSADEKLRGWFEALPPDAGGTLPPEVRIVWIGAVGDIMPARGLDDALLAHGGIEEVFGDTLPLLRSCDLLLGNLEGAATSGGARAEKTFTFRFRPEALGRLKEAGFAYLSLANNHTFDFGKRGFLDTLDNLSRWGIGTSGSGRNEREAGRPLLVPTGDGQLSLLSIGAYPVDRRGFDGRKIARAAGEKPGTLWSDEAGLSAVQSASATGAFTVVLVHGGLEWSAEPTRAQRDLYRSIVRKGARLVIGSHPHVLQGLESYGNGLIAFSMGNFLFPGMEGMAGGTDSAILRIGIFRGDIRYVQVFPVRLEGRRVRQDPAGPARAEILQAAKAFVEKQ